MTFIVLVLLFTLGFGLVLAAELLRSRSGEPGDPSLVIDSDHVVSFEPLERLVDNERAALVDSNPELAQKYGASRRRVLRAYLKALRTEYLRAFEICRLLAPVSQDPNFVSTLMRSYALFHVAYCGMWIRCTTGVAINPARILDLKQPLEQMRNQAISLLDLDAAAAPSKAG